MTTATTTLDRTDRPTVEPRDWRSWVTLCAALAQVRPDASLVNVARRNLDRACRG